MKPIPNRYIRAAIADMRIPNGTDGEIVTLDSETLQYKSFNDVQSDVMTEDGEPLFHYIVFDYAPENTLEETFKMRFSGLWPLNFRYTPESFVRDVSCQTHIVNKTNFLEVEKFFVESNYEGVILRQPNSQYWCGPNRPSLKQGSLVAVTAWRTTEAQVIGVEVQQENNNPVTRSLGGRIKRSKSKANMVDMAMVGKLIVEDVITKQIFSIGSGFTEKQKIQWWKNPSEIMGKTITYKHKPYGQKDLPRSPIFEGIRRDLE
jgi:ATP-dependent DNA ligase